MIRVGNYTVNEFKEKLKTRWVICFCAGQRFRDLCVQYQLEQKLLYVVDNYAKEKTVRIEERDVPIRGIGEMGEEIKRCLLLITSIKYADELIGQLDRIDLCDDLIFYIPELFEEETDHLEFAMEAPIKIPKHIHYCWFGGERIPERFRRNIESWKRHCPGYKITRWDEDDYDISKNHYMEQAYKAKMWGFVSDYARLDIVHTYGGIYLDTDVELLRPLDSLLGYDMFCGFESSEYVAFGLGFGAVKHHDIIKDILKEYDSLEFVNKNESWNLTTSPVYQTRVLERYGLIRNGKTQLRDSFITLAPEYLSPVAPSGFGRPTAHSFAVHQYAGTWLDEAQKMEKKKKMEIYRYIISRMEQAEGDI